jgi:hypothetical protein
MGFANREQITVSTLNNLANAAIAVSDVYDNSSKEFIDGIFEIYIDGTADWASWLDVRILASNDGINFATWECATPLGIITLTIDLQRAFFAFKEMNLTAPKYFKVAIKNNTGAGLAASGNTVHFMGIV